jgi:hypothetical protein
MQKAPSTINEVGDYCDCPQPVYDVLNMAIATDNHRSLAQYNFRLVFCQKLRKAKGRRTLASIKVLSDVDSLLNGNDILITIDYSWWTEHPEKQEALLFHELCHLQISEEGKLQTVGHDFEEFYATLKRYGDWANDVTPVVEALKLFEQAEIPLGV